MNRCLIARRILPPLLILSTLLACTPEVSEEIPSTGTPSPANPATDDSRKNTTILIFTSDLDENTLAGQSSKFFQQLVESDAGGNMRIALYLNGDLGNFTETAAMLKTGTTQISSRILGPSITPELSAFQLPCLFPDLDTASRVVAPGTATRAALEEKLIASGIRLLAVVPAGYRSLALRHRFQTADALKGLRVLTSYDSDPLIWECWGTEPVFMSSAESIYASHQGVSDALETSPDTLYNSHQYESFHYLLRSDYIMDFQSIMINEDFYQSLTPVQRAVLDQISEKLETYMYEEGIRRQNLALSEMSRVNLVVFSLQQSDRALLRSLAEPSYDKVRRSGGQALLALIQKDIAALQQPS